MNDEIFRVENVSRSFQMASGKLEILKDISFSVKRGESVSIVGKSGSGKSTLLSVAALIDRPTKGRVIYSGRDCSSLKDGELSLIRASVMGFVFQNSLLLEDFSALENVMFPLLNLKKGRKEAKAEAEAMLSSLGLSERMGHRPSQLSGGERQRTAIARALVTSPLVIFADEPTGALDEESAAFTENLLLSATRERGAALVLVTHNPAFAGRCSTSYTLTHKGLVLNEK